MATQTPWGKSQSATKIFRGLTWHSTAGHGGFLISKGVAERVLSDAARAQGDVFGNYFAYEEDVLCNVIFLEVPESRSILTEEWTEDMDQKTIKSLSRYIPEYLIERGITPDQNEFESYKRRLERDRLRSEKSPELVVAAQKVSDSVTKVWTADHEIHFVTAESYAGHWKKEYTLLSELTLTEKP